jgi:hypothetical protein
MMRNVKMGCQWRPPRVGSVAVGASSASKNARYASAPTVGHPCADGASVASTRVGSVASYVASSAVRSGSGTKGAVGTEKVIMGPGRGLRRKMQEGGVSGGQKNQSDLDLLFRAPAMRWLRWTKLR